MLKNKEKVVVLSSCCYYSKKLKAAPEEFIFLFEAAYCIKNLHNFEFHVTENFTLQ